MLFRSLASTFHYSLDDVLRLFPHDINQECLVFKIACCHIINDNNTDTTTETITDTKASVMWKMGWKDEETRYRYEQLRNQYERMKSIANTPAHLHADKNPYITEKDKVNNPINRMAASSVAPPTPIISSFVNPSLQPQSVPPQPPTPQPRGNGNVRISVRYHGGVRRTMVLE